MCVTGPSSVAPIEDMIQEKAGPNFLWCMLMYDKNEDKERLGDLSSFLEGSRGCTMPTVVFTAAEQQMNLAWFTPVGTPWHISAL